MSERRVLVNENSLVAIGSAIREKKGTDASYKPGDMAAAILEIQTGIEPTGDITITENGEYDVVNYAKAIVDVAGIGGGDIEIPLITGNCSYRFAYNGWDWIVDAYGNQMRTEDITNAASMFSDSTLTKIPFDINLKPSTSNSSGYQKLYGMFNNCYELEEIPNINNAFPEETGYLFYHCHNLRYLPEDLGVNWDWSRLHSYSSAKMSSMFYFCYSLRKVPTYFLENLYSTGTSSTDIFYRYPFSECYNLDEICNFPVSPATLSSSRFSNPFSSCFCLKKITFATNEDGTPIVAKWKSQTIDLTFKIGYNELAYSSFERDRSLYNSGRTIEKAIYDDATYAALKDDPDSYVCGYKSENPVDYSKYNHDSAVETINSLPDTSAYGTNTIKFLGASGSKTDGGAINTMTEEEIAVAAAKGWTVSFV